MEIRKHGVGAPSSLKKELTKSAIYHDALLQNGGAEKVALLWAKEFYTSIHLQDGFGMLKVLI